MTLAQHIRTLGRGPSFVRNLTRDEAAEAMGDILSGNAAPQAVGAFLMLMRFHGENADEIAGFVDAFRQSVTDWQTVDVGLDWPTYAAGRSRGLPWFLLSAKLVATAGVPVLLHGWNSHQNPVASVIGALDSVQIKQVKTPQAAQNQLDKSGIAYLPLAALSPAALELLQLRDVLGLRSAINTTLRMLNPCLANACVQGVFHPSYRLLQSDAGKLLGQKNLSVIKGGGGEFERIPGKPLPVYGLHNSNAFEQTAAPLTDDIGRLSDISSDPDNLSGLWGGDWENAQARAVVIGTAALALFTTGLADSFKQAEILAQQLWENRLNATEKGE